MDVLSYTLLFSTALFSGSLVFLIKKNISRYLKLSLAFSGAYLFTITITHLVPDLYVEQGHSAGIYILAGFFFQLLLEFFSEGIEHGHFHKHSGHKIPIAIILSLCIHSFMEGMPLAGKSNTSPLLTGIILHNIPVAFALTSMLIQAGLSQKNIFAILMIFSLMVPAGSVLSTVLSENVLMNSSLYFNNIMAFVIGIFLHISTTILFESYEGHRFNFIKFVTILIGGGLALLIF